MKALPLLAAASLFVTAGFAQELSWPELARRPELWPAHCTVKQAIRFGSGATVQAGQPLTVLQIKGNELELSTADGRTNFTAESDETDALAVAREAYARLTPKQRALTYPGIARDKTLWPTRVILGKDLRFDDGQSVRQGAGLVVMEVQPDRLIVKAVAVNAPFVITPPATDLMAQARKFVEDPQAGPRFIVEEQKLAAERKAGQEQQVAAQQQEQTRKAQVRVLGELEGRLVNSVTDQPEPLDPAAPPRYLVFYRGSSTCPITNRVTPSLIQWYQVTKPRHPEFDIIWIMTESPEDTGKFARKLGFDWRAIAYESTAYMPSVRQPITGLLPQLIVMDPSGHVLINAQQNAVPGAIHQLDALLQSSGQL